MASMVRGVITLWIAIVRSCAALFRSRQDQALVELALRQQLAIYARHGKLRRLLREYVDYYNDERVHTSIGDAPALRAAEAKPSPAAKVIALPRVRGLHHRYACRDTD